MAAAIVGAQDPRPVQRGREGVRGRAVAGSGVDEDRAQFQVGTGVDARLVRPAGRRGVGDQRDRLADLAAAQAAAKGSAALVIGVGLGGAARVVLVR
jgi:hypothetical protein